MIAFDNVYFSYEKEKTIKGVSFAIDKGEFVAIIGENGAGKSTLSKLFNGLLKPYSGSVTVDGMDTKTTKSSTLAKHIGFLFQNPDRQICKNTVCEEIEFGLSLVMDDKAAIKERLEQTIADFGFQADIDPFNLSRGERQRVALASLLAVAPDILVLDEPTTGLDYAECMRIMSIIRALNEKGVTVVMISHDMEVVLDFAKRVLVLSQGEIIADGETKEVFRKPDVLEKASLLPPQITQLALRLGKGFEAVFSVEAMAKEIASRHGKEGCQ